MTFNGGARWADLNQPERFRYPECNRCASARDPRKCQLHLHGPSSWHDGQGAPSPHIHLCCHFFQLSRLLKTHILREIAIRFQPPRSLRPELHLQLLSLDLGIDVSRASSASLLLMLTSQAV